MQSLFKEKIWASLQSHKEEGELSEYFFESVLYLACQGNSLLTYETSLVGKKLSLKLFDMGGGKQGGNIERFKRNFISDDGVWKYYAVKKIWNEEIYKVLVAQKRAIIKEQFFPLYRG